MRILLIVDCYLPSIKSSAKLIHDLAVEFCRRGHEVIVTAPADALAGPKQLAVEDGIKILRIGTGPIKQAGKITRGFNEARLSSVIWKAAKDFFLSNHCDLIVFYSPSIFFGRIVTKLKKLWQCKVYLVLRDIFPQWAVDTGILNKGLIYQYFKRKEYQQYEVADIIGVQSPANLDYFAEQRLDKRYKLEVLYNWTTTSEKSIALRNDRQCLGLNDKVVFFYGGNIGVAQDMNNIIRLATNLRDRSDIYFLLVGDGSEVPRLKAEVQKIGLNNISIHPAVAQEEYLGMLSQFDVGLISLDRKLKTHNFPGKMLSYMYFAMPILASINPGNDLRYVLEESRAGFVCLNGEHDRIREYALLLAEDVNLRREMGRNGRAAIEKIFCVGNAASQILSHIKNL